MALQLWNVGSCLILQSSHSLTVYSLLNSLKNASQLLTMRTYHRLLRNDLIWGAGPLTVPRCERGLERGTLEQWVLLHSPNSLNIHIRVRIQPHPQCLPSVLQRMTAEQFQAAVALSSEPIQTVYTWACCCVRVLFLPSCVVSLLHLPDGSESIRSVRIPDALEIITQEEGS